MNVFISKTELKISFLKFEKKRMGNN